MHIVGQDGQNSENITYMGLYKKEDPEQLVQYMENYRWAHFFMFPPGLTLPVSSHLKPPFWRPNDHKCRRGDRTTVKDKVSGIVLEKHSPGSEYARVIEHYRNHPDEYQALCRSTYERYLTELNWNALGDKIFSLIQELTHHK